MTPPGARSTSYEPVPDPAAAERECTGRLAAREGIPMVLALVDETADPVPVTDAPALAEGPRLAALLRYYADVLRPDAADDDEVGLQDVVTVLSWSHRPGTGT